MKFEFLSVNGFYSGPDSIRRFALEQKFFTDNKYFKGMRTANLASLSEFDNDEIKLRFEKLLNKKITKWDYDTNGCFQICTAEDLLVYHMDSQQYAAAIYLTPDAPAESGTNFYRSKVTGIRSAHDAKSDEDIDKTFKNGFYDKTQFELIDSIGNVYNRLVIWDAKLIHSAGCYFGNTNDSARLFQIFFFDVE